MATLLSVGVVAGVPNSGTGDASTIDALMAAGLKTVFANGGNLNATTSATGATFVAFASQACNEATITNVTGFDIEVQQGGAGAAFPVINAQSMTFRGITNMNQLSVRRRDTSNTQVIVTARWNS